jgi:hypothetical protein
MGDRGCVGTRGPSGSAPRASHSPTLSGCPEGTAACRAYPLLVRRGSGHSNRLRANRVWFLGPAHRGPGDASGYRRPVGSADERRVGVSEVRSVRRGHRLARHRLLGARHPERVVGIYTHHPNLHPVLNDDGRSLTSAEQTYLAARRTEHDGSDDGYAAIQSTRPDTLASALVDSPAGLAAWIVEKYRAWGDCAGDVESRFSKDILLTIATVYWATGTIGSSFRSYYDDDQTPPLTGVAVPAGVTLTPEDRDYPREYAERTYRDLRQWRGPTRGGHFLTLEEPDLLATDLQDFFRPLRNPN